jgi:hypothetical protein
LFENSVVVARRCVDANGAAHIVVLFMGACAELGNLAIGKMQAPFLLLFVDFYCSTR